MGILAMGIVMGLVATSAYAATSLSQSASVSVQSILSVEFASTADCTFASGSLPWTNVDPSVDYIRPTGSYSTKSDVGLYCRHNGSAAAWYLKMKLTTTNLTGKLYRMIPQPNLRDEAGTKTDGTVAGNAKDWFQIPATDTTVYTSGSNDKVNTPHGTYVGINYALRPEGLVNGGTGYSATIYYTITTTP